MRRAIFAGSFDPLHNGHLHTLKQAAALFDKVYWAIGTNATKQPMLSVAERLDMMHTVCDYDNVQPTSFDGLLVDFAVRVKATYLVRSLRVAMDFDYENQIARTNEALGAVQTVYFPASHRYSHLSSTLVRELLAHGRVMADSVPAVVERALRAK